MTDSPQCLAVAVALSLTVNLVKFFKPVSHAANLALAVAGVTICGDVLAAAPWEPAAFLLGLSVVALALGLDFRREKGTTPR